MKQGKMNIAVPVFIVAVAGTVCGVNAGDLNPPPGAIMPTDRVPLNQQAITLPFTISAPGSYVLTSNLIGSSGLDGIIIDADDVTLDLNGFTLIGVSGSLDGIRVNAARSHLSVTNGSIRGWGGNGINAGSCDNGRFEALSIGSSGIDGIIVGSNSIVRNLSVSGNGGAGIHVGGVRNRVDGCHATGNGTGINVLNIENLILRNSACGNGVDFNITAGSAFGPIVNVGGVGDISAVAAAIHPWANFSTTCSSNTWCRDFDGDTFGDASDMATGCVPPLGYVADCTDCDDANPLRYPGLPEVCDGIDNDCDLIPDNGPGMCGVSDECCSGVCVNVQFDPNNCGGCGNQCPNRPNATTNCLGGTCNYTCLAGFADCNNDMIDGCETSTTSDPNNCGACGLNCAGGSLCCNSICIDVQNDFSNCGGCGNQCSAGQVCVSASCCKPLGESCAVVTECCTGACVSGNYCQPIGGVCTVGAECCSGICMGGMCN